MELVLQLFLLGNKLMIFYLSFRHLLNNILSSVLIALIIFFSLHDKQQSSIKL